MRSHIQRRALSRFGCVLSYAEIDAIAATIRARLAPLVHGLRGGRELREVVLPNGRVAHAVWCPGSHRILTLLKPAFMRERIDRFNRRRRPA